MLLKSALVVNFINNLRKPFEQIFLRQKISKPNVTRETREKLLNLLLYKKCAHKMLMKLTPGFIIPKDLDVKSKVFFRNHHVVDIEGVDTHQGHKNKQHHFPELKSIEKFINLF